MLSRSTSLIHTATVCSDEFDDDDDDDDVNMHITTAGTLQLRKIS